MQQHLAAAELSDRCGARVGKRRQEEHGKEISGLRPRRRLSRRLASRERCDTHDETNRDRAEHRHGGSLRQAIAKRQLVAMKLRLMADGLGRVFHGIELVAGDGPSEALWIQNGGAVISLTCLGTKPARN